MTQGTASNNQDIITVAELIERIKDIACHKYPRTIRQNDVADLLYINQVNLASSKKRNSTPYKNVLLFCRDFGINPIWLLMKSGAGEIAA